MCPFCTPGKLKQMLKVFFFFLVPRDTGLLEYTEEPCRLNVGKIKESLTFHLTESLRKWHSSHPLFAETKLGGYQCGGNDFFWNPSLTGLTERSYFDEQRVKNASQRVTMTESVIDNPWQLLPSWCCETESFPLLIQKIRPDNFGDLFTLLGCFLFICHFFLCFFSFLLLFFHRKYIT